MDRGLIGTYIKALGLSAVDYTMLLKVLKRGCLGVSFVFYKDLWGMVSSIEDEFVGGTMPEACRPVRRCFESSRQKRRSIRIWLVEAADLGDEMEVDSDGSGGISDESQIRFWIPCGLLVLPTEIENKGGG